KEAVYAQKDGNGKQVMISAEAGYRENNNRGNKRSKHRNEFQRERERGQQHTIGHTHRGEENSISNRSRQAQDHESPHVLREQDVQIRRDLLERGLILGILDLRQYGALHRTTILEKEEAQDGNDYDEDKVGRGANGFDCRLRQRLQDLLIM